MTPRSDPPTTRPADAGADADAVAGSGRRGHPRRTTGGRTRSDRGAASVLVLAVAGLVVGLASVLTAVGAAAVARHRAASAADLAALAGADRTWHGAAVACAAAERAAGAVGARVRSCLVDHTEVTVVVEVRPAGPLGALGVATAVSRAGPPGPPG